ncbi:hypothetical protein IP90_02772 [Luteimonas cucumeris]|uniref:DUF2272 domain-containing protein n=1 Tax=Luteimonas cucumeris TaxID=985012 RepID=A0A562KY87_9GAMM|nr:DUF2272 domain-containing protein [Luteimonas cucumeris]TWI00226.1 hypothetical protein IP90_02772 [Luteimonas cucumeris]
MNRNPGALACAALLSLIVTACSSNVRKPPPGPTPPVQPQTPASPRVPQAQGSLGSAERITSIARREHVLWYQPFIDSNGRLASLGVTEAEQSQLADGTEAWQRVLGYWRNSGTLYEMAQSNIGGAYACQYPSGYAQGKAECRAFLVDNAWSAAFVSYVMIQAGVPGFRSSPRHFDYIRQAYRGEGPYLFVDPIAHRPAPGDLLCFVRDNGSIPGYAGLSSRFGSGNDGSLATHCDIVIGRDASGRELHVVGGNVFDSVTLRKLKLDPQGYVILPHTLAAQGMEAYCSPANETACNFNRQNWAVLLKLRPTVSRYATPAAATPTAPRYITPQRAAPAATPTPAPAMPAAVPAQPAAPAPATPTSVPTPTPTQPVLPPATPTVPTPQPTQPAPQPAIEPQPQPPPPTTVP